MTPERRLLLAAPLLLLLEPAGLTSAAPGALAAWLAAGALARRPALYPMQRRPRADRLFPVWAACCLCLRVLSRAVPLPGPFPAWAGTVFFSLVLCHPLLRWHVRRSVRLLLGATCIGLLVFSYFLEYQIFLSC